MGKTPNAVWGLYGENTQCRMGTVWGLYPPPYELTLLGSSQLKSYTIHTPGMGKTFSDGVRLELASEASGLQVPLAALQCIELEPLFLATACGS